eukprot:8192905-Pyramimonas_sp.AAC.1
MRKLRRLDIWARSWGDPRHAHGDSAGGVRGGASQEKAGRAKEAGGRFRRKRNRGRQIMIRIT